MRQNRREQHGHHLKILIYIFENIQEIAYAAMLKNQSRRLLFCCPPKINTCYSSVFFKNVSFIFGWHKVLSGVPAAAYCGDVTATDISSSSSNVSLLVSGNYRKDEVGRLLTE